MNEKSIGSLFSGIGGLELGLERAGFGPVIWQAENNPFCLKVLERHWPRVRRYNTVEEIDEKTETPFLICAGFPCQPWSVAGKKKGKLDVNNLWPDTIRIIRLLRSPIVVLENVPAILANPYFGRILGDLAESGYHAKWDCIPASAVGAHHRRDRLFIVAYSEVERLERGRKRLPRQSGRWNTESGIRRVANGIPYRVDRIKDRIKALGNAVVPQVSEYIGEMIMNSLIERETR